VAISRAVHFVQYYKRTLDRHEARLKLDVASAADRTREMCERSVAALKPHWSEIERAAAESVVSFLDDPRAMRAAKEYTEAALTPLLMGAPIVQRAYAKPLGYPGDYQTMLYTYANSFEGASAFDQVFHKLHVEHPLANGIRTRKDFILEQMKREHDRALAHGKDDYRVTSLGCGPAREVVDFVHSRRDWRGKVAWTLIDQEEETLSVAFRDGQKALMDNHARGELSCLNLSFVQLLTDTGSILSTAPQQDFVYSVGLFDYLREDRAQALVKTLYERLSPGGLLAIGNAIAPNLHFWSLEMVLDWTLLYRTSSQMSKLAARLPSQAEISVATEPGQAYFFLLVRRH
jgi:SAM-dependent methyltransferase